MPTREAESVVGLFAHRVSARLLNAGASWRASCPRPSCGAALLSPVLIDSLMSATQVPVVLVSAPAGYGMTTLLALWAARDERPFGWVTLEAADNDPVALMAGVLAALDPI